MNFRDWLEEIDYSKLPSISILKTIMLELVAAAQSVYNDWEQDDEGWDEMYAGGGYLS